MVYAFKGHGEPLESRRITMSIIPEILENMKVARKSGLKLAFAYDRISDDVQSDGISLEFQADGAAKYARDNDLFIVHNFRVIESASREGRKVFNEMIDLALNFGIKNLIFKNTDRMSRNYQDLVRIEKLIDRDRFDIHFYQSNLVINENSSYNDRFLIGIQLAVAKHLSDKISQDVKEHNSFKAARGVAPGPSPFGYKYDRKGKKHVQNPEEYHICRYIFDTYDAGSYSLNSFVALLNRKGFKTRNGKEWRKGPLHHMLTNPFYYGDFLYRGELWSGDHEPYFEKDRFNRRKERLARAYVGERKRDFEFSLAGHLRCGCGRLLTGQEKKGRYVYYTHDCAIEGKFVYIKEDDIFAAIESTIKAARYSYEFSENLKLLFRNVGENQSREHQSEIDQLAGKAKTLMAKKSRLYDLYSDDGMDRELLKEKIDGVNAELKKLEVYRQSFTAGFDDAIFQICDIIDRLRDRPAALLAAEKHKKAEILREISEGVDLARREGSGGPEGWTATIRWKKPFSFVMEAENARKAAMEAEFGDSPVTARPVLLPR